MTFNKVFSIELVPKIVSFSTTIPLAIYLGNYWALLIGMISNTTTTLVLSYTMHKFRPKLSLKFYREIMGFSIWLLANNILFFINTHAPNITLGKTIGIGSVGLFSISQEIANLASAEISAPINRSAFPGLAKFSNDPLNLKKTYLLVMSSICLLAAPTSIGVMVTAPHFVPIFLGEKWISAIPLIQTISIASLLTAINSCSGYLYLATGRPNVVTKLFLIQTSILIPSIIYASQSYGLEGTAKAILATSAIALIMTKATIIRTENITISDIIKSISRPLISSIIMGLAINKVFEDADNNITNLILEITLGATIFITATAAIWILCKTPEGPESHILSSLQRIITKEQK